jgi:hypothetical protein
MAARLHLFTDDSLSSCPVDASIGYETGHKADTIAI